MSTQTSPENYDIKAITDNDTEAVLENLRKNFFRDEPLNASINLIEDENSTCMELERYCVHIIKQKLSIMAVAPGGGSEIIGVCLNGILDKNQAHEGGECENLKFAKIVRFLDVIEEQGDVFGKFPNVQKILTVKIISVNGSARGKGIAKKLMNRSRIIAGENGCELMRVDCSSHFTARAIAKLGFDCIYSMKYEDYKVDGKAVFKPEEPHTDVTIYVQNVSKL